VLDDKEQMAKFEMQSPSLGKLLFNYQ